MSERRQQIHTAHKVPRTRRCELLEVARSSAYYRPEPVSETDLMLMRLSDEIPCSGRFTAVGGSATNWKIAATWSTASGSNV